MAGQLTLAKAIGDKPSAYSVCQLRDAELYLARLRTNGGVRNSERASGGLERRIAAIASELQSRTVLTEQAPATQAAAS